MSQYHWTTLSVDDLPRLQVLAKACLDTDGGLPDLADEDYLRAHFADATTIAAADVAGELVAAAAIGVSSEGLRVATGFVHPSARGQGLGDALMEWALQLTDGMPVTVAVDNATDVADAVMEHFGLERIFAETVMRHRLNPIPRRPRPRGLRSLWFSADSAPMFHRAWRESFADRPGFVDLPEEVWTAGVVADPRFRPADSCVLLTGGGRPVAFCTLSGAWIEQVGVVPDQRGQGVGAHLVARSLSRFLRAGEHEAWLTVSVDNPAHALYERLGFRDHGTRAVYSLPGWPRGA